MPLSIPPELKKIAPFVRRAEELDKDKNNPESRLVSYYCRQYAVHTGIPLAATSANAKVCLGSLLEALEKEKPAMDNFTREEAKYVCTEFANKIFNKANEEDIAGNATKETAKTFYAAASFLQILDQFHAKGGGGEILEGVVLEESEEVQQNKKQMLYAKWKATEILKAIKEGRKPTPGGYEKEEQQQDEDQQQQQQQKQTQPDATTTTTTTSSSSFIDHNGKQGTVSFANADSDDSVEDVTPASELLPPAPPTEAPFAPPPASLDKVEEYEEDGDEQGDEEGTEVELGPPPAYPGGSINTTISPLASNNQNRPPMTFKPTPAPVPPPSLPSAPPAFSMPTPPSAPPVVSAPPATTTTTTKKSVGGMFGFGKKKGPNKVSKAQLADAIELTKFALVALEDRNTDLGADRLQQALEALGR